MYPENPEGTQVIVGSMNMGYISDTARNRTHNLFRPKRESIPLGHSDGLLNTDTFKKQLKNHLHKIAFGELVILFCLCMVNLVKLACVII